MKKITALFLTLMMLLSICSIGAAATGELIHSDDFSAGFTPKNWLVKNSAYTWDKANEYIYGYGDAYVLESNYEQNRWWDDFYASFDFRICDDDNTHPSTAERPHTVSIWYRDLMENDKNGGELGAIYMFTLEVETRKALLHKYYDFSYKDENGITQKGKVDACIAEAEIEETIEVGESAPFYNFGIRVTDGKIECYFNEKLVVSSSVSDGTAKIGHVSVDSVDETVGTQKSAVLFFNGGGQLGPEYYHLGASNYLMLDNFEVWTADYDFASVTYGDVNGDGNVNLSDISMMLQAIAKWEIEGYTAEAGDVNGDGAVNLSDVSKTLQAIAKWEGVVLGPTA